MAIYPVAGLRYDSARYGPRFGGQQINTGFAGVPSSHGGLDIFAKAGQGALAAVAGVVAQVHQWTGGKNDPYGNYIDLKGDDGNTYRYAHLSSLNVRPGQRVGEGALLGGVGSTGNASGDHLHFEVIQPNGQRTNPEPYIRSASMASSDPTLNTPGGPIGPPGPPAAPGGTPPGGDDRDARRRILDLLRQIDSDLQAAKYPEDRAKLLATQQALLRDLTAIDKPGGSETAAEAALKNAQASYYTTRAGAEQADRDAANARAAGQNQSAEAIAAARNATDLQQTAMTTATSRYGTDVDAATSRANNADTNATQRYGYDLAAAQQAANLEWDKEQARILQAFNEKKLGWEQAVAAATEARERLTLQLTQQRNAIEAASVEAQQRGQDLSAGVTQRGQDLEAQTTVRGQDIGRLNQATQSGASLLGNAMSTAANIGSATGSTALGALRYYAPANASEAFNRAGQGQAPNLGTVRMPFDPATIVQQAADAAYAKFAPPGQALIAAGQAPSPAFVAPGQIVAPPRVVPNVQPVNMGAPMLRAGGGGFVAP